MFKNKQCSRAAVIAVLCLTMLLAALPTAAAAEQQTPETAQSETVQTPETADKDPEQLEFTGDHLEGYSLTLAEEITLHFYVTLPENTPQDACMQFTLPDGTVTQVPLAQAERTQANGKDCVSFPCRIAPEQMTDTIRACMVVNGQKGREYAYTVKQYAEYLMQNSNVPQARALASALLVYGAKAQLYFGYRTETPASRQEPASIANWGNYQFESTGTQTENYYGSNLQLQPRTQLRHYFLVPDGADYTFTFKWDETAPEIPLQPMDTGTRFDGKEVYYVTTPAIPPSRLYAMPAAVMYQGGSAVCTLYYGVFSYGDMLRAICAVDESQLPLLNLLRAMDDYAAAVQNYRCAG